MSSGSVSLDNRQWVTTSCGNSYVGTVVTKVWSGANGPKNEEHPYTMSYSLIDNPLINWRLASGTKWYDGSAASCGFMPTGSCPQISDNQMIKLTNKLLTQVKGHSFNAAVSLGEAKESYSMLVGTVKTLASSFLCIRKGNFAGAIKSLGFDPTTTRVKDLAKHAKDSAGDGWLALTYGWKPLLSTIDDSMEALVANLGPKKLSVSGSVRQTGSVYGTGGGFSAEGKCYRGRRVKWIIEEGSISTLAEFGFLSSELVAWELFPYSHVVDWLYPIGPWLEARAGVENLVGTAVTSDYYYLSSRLGTSPLYVVDGTAYKKDITLNRTVGPISSSSIPTPAVKNPLSPSHFISALALLNNVFRGKA